MLYALSRKGGSPRKEARRMKFNPTPKEARALADPQEARDLRRQINKEVEKMAVKELQATLRHILKRKE
jgi:hypothetical protein